MPFMSLSIAKFVTNSHIYPEIYVIFLKNVLKQTWNSFNTKFRLRALSAILWGFDIFLVFRNFLRSLILRCWVTRGATPTCHVHK